MEFSLLLFPLIMESPLPSYAPNMVIPCGCAQIIVPWRPWDSPSLRSPNYSTALLRSLIVTSLPLDSMTDPIHELAGKSLSSAVRLAKQGGVCYTSS